MSGIDNTEGVLNMLGLTQQAGSAGRSTEVSVTSITWDQVECDSDQCTHEHHRFIDFQTGELVGAVHGPDELKVWTAIYRGSIVGQYIDLSAAKRAVETRHITPPMTFADQMKMAMQDPELLKSVQQMNALKKG